MKYNIVLLGLVLHFTTVSPANILAILTLPSPSHHIWNSVLMVALAERGHNVTIFTVDPMKTPVPNTTDIVVTGIYEEINEAFNYEEMTDLPLLDRIKDTFKFCEFSCQKALESDGYKQLLDYPSDSKFDVIISEAWCADCLLGAVATKFGNPPVIFVHAYSINSYTAKHVGSPYYPSFMPQIFTIIPEEWSFWDRLSNFIVHILFDMGYEYYYLPKMDQIARTQVGPDVPSVREVFKRVSVALGNYHPALEPAFPLTPNYIPVGGMQIKEPKPLPKELQLFLDEAKDGAILFSLGSNVQSSNLPPEKLNAILDAFREIPQRVLWKFELDSLKNLPNNVKLSKWMPQTDILAHPNIKLFISHCGLLSTHEAVYREVPVIGMPFIGDQFANSRTLMRHGVAKELLFQDLTKEMLLKAISEVLHNPSYRENMQSLSERFRGNPMKPLDTAVFWTEYVINNKGASHLRPASLDMNMIQYLLLDVIAFILAIAVTVIYVPICLWQRIRRDEKKMKQN